VNSEKNKKDMKTNMIKVLILCGLFFICLGAFAQVPPPPPGGGHGGTGNQEGGGAPIGSGIGILLVLGAAYGGKKLYKAIHDENNEMEE
jgi:hypothetical protein